MPTLLYTFSTAQSRHHTTMRRLTALLLLLALPCYGAAPLKIGWSPWPPFQYEDHRQRLTGIDIELTRSVLERLGREYRFVSMPWARSLHALQYSEIDVAMGARYLPERARLFDYSEPYRYSDLVLLLRSEEQEKWRSLTDYREFCRQGAMSGARLRGVKILGQLPCPALQRFRQENSDDRLLLLLLSHRVDGIIMERHNASALLRETPGKMSQVHCQLLLERTPVHLIFTKGRMGKEGLKQINLLIEQQREEGTSSSPCTLME
ncbi:extracellular solute-binding protein [Aeromonas diversa CDC 2478-85]|uniref:Extracellular solute-binding protein n=2 Tax=Aeromonas diversa TaxID=502790 RepID=N9VGD8_9GAMM|nr:extracellular solute-binding protein [Aeromonas diversa CDC 2478-85]